MEAKRRESPAGSKLMSDHCHDVLDLVGVAEEGLELVGPFGQRRWAPVPPERCTDEYVQRETVRLSSELGVRLGVGPMP